MAIGSQIVRIPAVNSTNNYAAEQLLTKRLPDGVVFVTDSQIDGRGQGVNRWESEPHKNLTFSLVVYPHSLLPSRQFVFSQTIALGVADFLSKYTPDVAIKWPNDLYVGDNKIGGILIENSLQGAKIDHSIVGIGLNVNQLVFRSEAPNPISLQQLTGLNFDLIALLAELCGCLNFRYKELLAGAFDRLEEDYISMLYRYQRWSLYRDLTGKFEGMIEGVDRYGHLQVRLKDGSTAIYGMKEVEFLF